MAIDLYPLCHCLEEILLHGVVAVKLDEPFPILLFHSVGVEVIVWVFSFRRFAHSPDGVCIPAEIDGRDEGIAEVVCRVEGP